MDVSLDLKQYGNLSDNKKLLISKALKTNCKNYYENFEIWGTGRTINRNHWVITFIFPEEEEISMIKFIKFIKNETSCQIEMIGYENCIYKIIYASKKYLSFMERDMAKQYLKRKKLLYSQYRNIVNEIRK